MISYLLAYVCTTAAMDDCQVWAPASWEGPNAATQCQAAKAPELARLRLEYRNFYARVECESQSTGE